MTSGRFNTPKQGNCVVCNGTLTWFGGRPKKYCSQRCIQWAYEYRKNPNRKQRQYGPPAPAHVKTKIRNRKARRLTNQAKFDAKKCCDCGLLVTQQTLPCFAFDHRNPTEKSFTISREVGRVTDDVLQAEIAKCDVVCHNCHSLRTHRQRNG